MMPAAVTGTPIMGSGLQNGLPSPNTPTEIQGVFSTLTDGAMESLKIALQSVGHSSSTDSPPLRISPSDNTALRKRNSLDDEACVLTEHDDQQPSTSNFVSGSSEYTPGHMVNGHNGYTHAPIVALRATTQTAPDALGPDDIPAPPPHPTDPNEIRKLFRATAIRCKKCKNRFVERDLYERHLKAKHIEEYILYMEEQARIMEQERLEELQQVRREEILSGGYIPPLSEIDTALNYANLDPGTIPLPGEETGGIAPTFDRWGAIKMPRRTFPYKKKVSPQCPCCDKRFRNQNSLKKHIVKKHPEFINFLQCNRCFKAVKDHETLMNHPCDLLYVCFQCMPIRNMCSADRLEIHRSKFHRGNNSGFKCNECSRKFLTPRKLRKHKKMSHIVTKPYKCHFCDEYHPTETQVSLHERIHTGKVKFECNICDFRTNRWSKLNKHKQEEHGYLCCICHEKMAEYSELKFHTLEKHGGYLTSESQAVCIESPRIWVLLKGE